VRKFQDKVAVVTGAASGIGFSMAERFAQEGMHVVLADIEREALARAESNLSKRAKKVLAVVTDVSKPESVDALAKRTRETFGAVHVVCNNAGVGNPALPIWENTLADWQWVLGVNLWGVVHGIRTFVPILLRQGEPGHVVNTASMAGLMSSARLGIYNASKHAVVAISETLHAELAAIGSQVKVSVLCPAFVQTNIGDSARNRPPELPAPADSAEAEAFRKIIRDLLAAGIPPSVVAGRVFDAIRDEQLYILTHPETKPLLQRHMEDVIAERNPDLTAGIVSETVSAAPR
jgi:NAD(P)-dependent dehydrogenase (short-subunit alcohol dehydrogenase family)